jgi:hypothetical protein
LAFNWDKQSPAPGAILPNLFSIRWSQKFVINNEGRYTFYLDADDSAVVRINGETFMRYRFNQREDRVQIATRYLSQDEELDIEVEYVEKWGNASIKFWWERATEPPCWYGHYFGNADLAGKVVAQEMVCDNNIRKHWGNEDPWPADLGPDTPFSTCWTRVIEAPMPTDRYQLCLYVKDSARLWFNRTLLINKRSIGTEPKFICKTVNFGQNRSTHVLRLDLYRKSKGDAVLGFYLVKHMPQTPWVGAFFDDTNMTGPPTFIRTARDLNFPSHEQDLDSRIDNAPFSSLWRRKLPVQKGIFHFYAEHDDGVKLISNSSEIINDWYSGDVRTQKRVYSVTDKETLDLRVEYYHDNQDSDPKLHVWWERATPTPTITPTPSLTPTPSPTFLPTHTPQPPITSTPTRICVTPTPKDPETNP